LLRAEACRARCALDGRCWWCPGSGTKAGTKSLARGWPVAGAKTLPLGRSGLAHSSRSGDTIVELGGRHCGGARPWAPPPSPGGRRVSLNLDLARRGGGMAWRALAAGAGGRVRVSVNGSVNASVNACGASSRRPSRLQGRVRVRTYLRGGQPALPCSCRAASLALVFSGRHRAGVRKVDVAPLSSKERAVSSSPARRPTSTAPRLSPAAPSSVNVGLCASA
jgi:hypothetical protein